MVDHIAPDTVLVPLTGLVRMPLHSPEARAEFIASLEAESAKIKHGQYTLFERDALVAWMTEGCKDLTPEK